MCGICGIVKHDRQPVEKELIREMCASFSYRGPDDEGIYTSEKILKENKAVTVGFGQKRLSIIDLSEAAHQPMSNEDGSVWITYNGEIYNFKEIKAYLEGKGHIFQSHSDTEVIVHLYEEEGTEAVHRFNGMFAFGLWDQKACRLWICRDRIGIKPLVYYWDGRHFAFASEIKALLKDPAVPKELDWEALHLYLTFNYVPAPYTIFKGIRKLRPGHFLVLENGELKEERYWDIPQPLDCETISMPFGRQIKMLGDRLYQSLHDAVGRRLVSDVPLGAFLSGGIDSSIIVALMSMHAGEPVKTYSIGFEGIDLFDETRYARSVADYLKTDHHEFKLSYHDMIDVLPSVLSMFDEPFADSSAIPTYIVSRETKNHVTVALSGDGGDELFGGYRFYLGEYWYKKYTMIPALIRGKVIEKLVGGFPDSRDIRILEMIRRVKKFLKGTKGSFSERLLSWKEIFPRDLRNRLVIHPKNSIDCSDGDLARLWVESNLAGYRGDRINQMLFADVKDLLPGDMLTKVDWMSMRNSLEVRVPFLDHHLVELAFQIQGALKLHKGKTKYILKETFKNHLPKNLYKRPKAGFEVPISRWLRTDLRFLIHQYLSEERIRDQGIFDYVLIDNLIRDHLSMRTDTSWMLWNLIVFQYWYDQYFL